MQDDFGSATIDALSNNEDDNSDLAVITPNEHNDTAEHLEAEAPLAAEPNGFEQFALTPELLKAVVELGYNQPMPVQMETLTRMTNGTLADVMVSSRTGSGKTAAFLLPVLQAVQMAMADQPRAPHPKRMKGKPKFEATKPLALVLCPTRELAMQVSKDAINLVRYTRGLRVACVMGGTNYHIQREQLQNASIVIATPGRLLDLQRTGSLDLGDVKALVIDEADRMLDLGFAEDLATIDELTKTRLQTLMFSATFAPRIMALGERITNNAQRIELQSAQDKHDNIEQRLLWADDMQHQRALLDHCLRDASIEQAIVFASTQVECDELANDLIEMGHEGAALHGAMSQALRNRRLQALRQGRIRILVATDVAARGLDVPTITHVFNYGLPMKPEDYTHRIGRTGRAGRSGLAITIAPQRSRGRIRAIEEFTQQRFKASVIPGLEPKVQARPSFGGRPGGRSDSRGGPRGDFGGNRGSGSGFGGPRGGDRGGNFGRGFGNQFEGNRGAPAESQRFAQRPAPAGPGGFGAPRDPQRTDTRDFDPRFAPRDGQFAPRQDRFSAPREDRFNAPRGDRFGAPRQDRFSAPRQDGFAPARPTQGFVRGDADRGTLQRSFGDGLAPARKTGEGFAKPGPKRFEGKPFGARKPNAR
jgi:superfamily II DNA/RNA helicase